VVVVVVVAVGSAQEILFLLVWLWVAFEVRVDAAAVCAATLWGRIGGG
jgi:hypothetical protein